MRWWCSPMTGATGSMPSTFPGAVELCELFGMPIVSPP